METATVQQMAAGLALVAVQWSTLIAFLHAAFGRRRLVAAALGLLHYGATFGGAYALMASVAMGDEGVLLTVGTGYLAGMIAASVWVVRRHLPQEAQQGV